MPGDCSHSDWFADGFLAGHGYSVRGDAVQEAEQEEDEGQDGGRVEGGCDKDGEVFEDKQEGEKGAEGAGPDGRIVHDEGTE